MFQAATQINEQTLSFLPRLALTLLTLIFLGPFICREIMNYTLQLFAAIPQLVG
jgi:flagellar biosynthetic protein FliQ